MTRKPIPISLEEARETFREWDAKQLEPRSKRLSKLVRVTYGQGMPNVSWDYIIEAKDCYKYGMFRSAVILAAVAFESGLRGALIPHLGKKAKKLKSERLIAEAASIKLKDDKFLRKADRLRRLRNMYAHYQLEKIGKGHRFLFERGVVTKAGSVVSDPVLVVAKTRDEKITASYVVMESDALRAVRSATNLLLKLFPSE